MNEAPSAAYQFDHTHVDMCELDPFSLEGPHVKNFERRYIVICYDPFSRLVEKTFFLTEEPTEHNIHELISTLAPDSERASPD
jgi:hypothetical protein